jgi:ketosteroid isomerase-like protein
MSYRVMKFSMVALAAAFATTAITLADDRLPLKQWSDVWNPKGEVASFDQDRLARVYDTSAIVAFDTNSPASTILSGWKTYSDTWVPYMKGAGFWETVSVNVVKTEVVGDFGYSAITYTASAQPEGTANREVYTNHATLIWKKSDNGWKIVHEHISNPVKK